MAHLKLVSNNQNIIPTRISGFIPGKNLERVHEDQKLKAALVKSFKKILSEDDVIINHDYILVPKGYKIISDSPNPGSFSPEKLALYTPAEITHMKTEVTIGNMLERKRNDKFDYLGIQHFHAISDVLHRLPERFKKKTIIFLGTTLCFDKYQSTHWLKQKDRYVMSMFYTEDTDEWYGQLLPLTSVVSGSLSFVYLFKNNSFSP